MNKYIVTLTKEERELLSALASKGEHKTQKILNALIFFVVMLMIFKPIVQRMKRLPKF